jgi:hypothetical protein
MFTPRFGTAVTCMDGRIQLPVIRYLKARYSLDYVDVIAEPGMNGFIAEYGDEGFMDRLVRKIRISLEGHGSRHIAVVGHHDCLGNPVPREKQHEHTRLAIQRLKPIFMDEVIFCGLWVNERWGVNEIPQYDAGWSVHLHPESQRREKDPR